MATLNYGRADGSTNTLSMHVGALEHAGEAVFVQPSGGPVPSAAPGPCT